MTSLKVYCIVVLFSWEQNKTTWRLTDLQTNHSLVPVCQWFVSCIGGAAWENWHGACYRATEWYAYVFGSAWSLLVWRTEHGAKELPRRHEWFWCPCSHHLINISTDIIYWQHGVFLWVLYNLGDFLVWWSVWKWGRQTRELVA